MLPALKPSTSQRSTCPTGALVLDENDILVGNWAPETRTFTDNLQPFNAVQVTTRLAEVNNNPISHILLRRLRPRYR